MSKLLHYCFWFVLGFGAYLATLAITLLEMLLSSLLDLFLGKIHFDSHFIGPLLFGIALGIAIKMRAAWTVIVIPLLIFISEVRLNMKMAVSMNTNPYRYVFDNFFGTQCQSSECLNELLITTPLVIAIAFYVSNVISQNRRTGYS